MNAYSNCFNFLNGFVKIFSKFFKIIINLPTLLKILIRIFLHCNIVAKFYNNLLEKYTEFLKIIQKIASLLRVF